MADETIEITTTLGQEVINVTINGYSLFTGTLKLGQLLDVNETSPSNNDQLVYDSTTNKWINKKLLIVDNDYECLIGEV